MEIAHRWNLSEREKRGSFEGAIRIHLRASLFLFNDLAFLRVPRKSLKFLTLLFSIFTALYWQKVLRRKGEPLMCFADLQAHSTLRAEGSNFLSSVPDLGGFRRNAL